MNNTKNRRAAINRDKKKVYNQYSDFSKDIPNLVKVGTKYQASGNVCLGVAKNAGDWKPWRFGKHSQILHPMTVIQIGKIVSPYYREIRQGKGGCRTCATSGFQYDKESYLYLITHQQFNAHKVGIANRSKVKSTDRLYRHKQEGWEVVEAWNFDDGYAVTRIESNILSILRKDMSIPQYLIKGQMKFGGQTETMDSNLVSIPVLRKIIKKSINEVLKGNF